MPSYFGYENIRQPPCHLSSVECSSPESSMSLTNLTMAPTFWAKSGTRNLDYGDQIMQSIEYERKAKRTLKASKLW